MFKFTRDGFLAYPLHTSGFAVLFALMVFMPLIRPPVILSLLLVSGLVYLSMFFGVKFYVGDRN